MRVAIAGAGAVGRSIALALLEDDHKVLLIERHRPNYQPALVPAADWMLADACEVGKLQDAGIDTCDVVMAAAGDDKVNLVFALLAKTEFGVPRVVARVNDPANHWLFDQSWGVDVAVSTPGAIVAAVEQAVTIGDIVRLMTLQQSQGDIVEITLAANSHLVGRAVGELALPAGSALLMIVRDRTLLTPHPQTRLQPDDEVVVLASSDVEQELRAMLRGDR
jgi:trk system potassium uptake protein TrkA